MGEMQSFFWFFVAHLGLLERERVRDELEVPKGGMQKGRSEELAAIFEDFGLGDDEAIVDDFEKLGLHSENVVVIEYIGNLGPMLVRHG